METKRAALLALVLLAACSGNPLGTDTDPDPDPPCTDNCPIEPDDPVTVPASLKNNVDRIVYDKGSDTFQVAINDLDTTPVLATWARNATLDTNGYRAYSVQEDALDRMFIGLGDTSADGSVTAAVAGDGGQFNKFFSGGSYSRTGGFTPPEGTTTDGSGQVSYAGTYAGITNIRAPGGQLIPPDPGTDPELLPGQASRTSGDIFLNANFDDNAVNGAIYNRVLVDYGFGLQSVILVPTTIEANGTFTGTTERWVNDDANMTGTGNYGGVFGGANAGNVAGIVALDKLYDGAGDEIENARERGVFVLRQCGLSGDSVVCDQTEPEINN